VPTRPGAHTLPKVTLPVWEPERGRWRLLEGPTLSFVATGAALAEDDDDDPAGEGAARDGDRDAEGEASGDGEDASAFGPLRQESALLRRRAPVSGRPWYPAAAAAPPSGSSWPVDFDGGGPGGSPTRTRGSSPGRRESALSGRLGQRGARTRRVSPASSPASSRAPWARS